MVDQKHAFDIDIERIREFCIRRRQFASDAKTHNELMRISLIAGQQYDLCVYFVFADRRVECLAVKIQLYVVPGDKRKLIEVVMLKLQRR